MGDRKSLFNQIFLNKGVYVIYMQTKVFYKTTTSSKRPLLSGPKSGRLIQVWLYTHP